MALSITKLARNVGRRSGYSFLRLSKSLNKLSSQVSPFPDDKISFYTRNKKFDCTVDISNNLNVIL